MPKLVNKRDLAELLGVTERTLTNWQKVGMPIHATGERGEASEYDVPLVIKWLIKRRLAEARVTTPRDRLADLQGQRIAVELARQRGDLAPSAEYRAAWRALVVEARQTLLALPSAIVPELVQAADADAMHALLEVAIEGALHELAGGAAPAADTQPGRARAAARGPIAVGPAAADAALGMGRGKPPLAGGLDDAREISI